MSQVTPTPSGPLRDLTSFAHALRGRGLTVTPDQVGDMARALGLIDPARRDHVHSALRSLAITDPDQRGIFEEEFDRFFRGLLGSPPVVEPQLDENVAMAVNPLIQTGGQGDESEAKTQTGASAVERLQRRDFAELEEDDMSEARRLVMSMVWEPTDVKTRRWLRATTGPQPDMRRTLRRLVRPDGDLMPIVQRQRRLRQRPLIVIADISGSMESYADIFLVFCHAAQRRLDQVEVFTFSTRLTRISEQLRRRDIASALDAVTSTVGDWSGGTKIGDAFAEWNRSWSRRLSRGGPIVLILSDGWDCGDPELLSVEMARLSRSVHKVIWLNPLAARSEYRPATRGMQAVLPHIDYLLPAASVTDLRGVVRLLDSLTR